MRLRALWDALVYLGQFIFYRRLALLKAHLPLMGLLACPRVILERENIDVEIISRAGGGHHVTENVLKRDVMLTSNSCPEPTSESVLEDSSFADPKSKGVLVYPIATQCDDSSLDPFLLRCSIE